MMRGISPEIFDFRCLSDYDEPDAFGELGNAD
jgi:hypothetical protein